MSDPLSVSLKISGTGLQSQAERMRVVSENLANAQSTGNAPGADAFQRKLMIFNAKPVDDSDFQGVNIARIMRDTSAFRMEHEPSHPAADSLGQVKYPNVNPLIELADMREASRSYEANLQVMKQARQMIQMTIDLLRQ